MSESVEEFMNLAATLAVQNVKSNGGPFGAIVVTANGNVYNGVNRVTDDNDPTAHAEVSAIRNACRGEGTFDLTGATIYSSCEPCPMCLGACLWARIDNIFFGADRYEAAKAGFDDAAFYELMANPPTRQIITEVKNAPFEEWEKKSNRTNY